MLILALTFSPITFSEEPVYKTQSYDSDGRDAFYLKWQDTIYNGSYNDIWCNDTHAFASVGSAGLIVYYVDDAYQLHWNDTADNGTHTSVWCDGTYIYTGTDTSLYAYLFSAGHLIYINSSSVNAYDVWGDGTYIYCSEEGVTDYLHVLSFDGNSFTLLDSRNTTTATATHIYGETRGPVTYVYLQTYNEPLYGYVFNRTSDQTWDDTIEISYGGDFGHNIFVKDGLIFYTHSAYLRVLSFNGTDFSVNCSGLTTANGFWDVWVTDGFITGNYFVFTSELTFNMYLYNSTASTMTLLDREGYDVNTSGGVWGCGIFTYPDEGFLVCGGVELDIVTGFGTKFIADTIYVSGSMDESWYNYDDQVPDLEYAMNNIESNGFIYLWNGTYYDWNYSRYSPFADTEPRATVEGVTIFGNSSIGAIITERFICENETTILNTYLNGLYVDSDKSYVYIIYCNSYDDIEILGHNSTVMNCTIFDAVDGVELQGSLARDNIIRNCYFYGCNNEAINIVSGANNNSAYDNIINATGQVEGIEIDSSNYNSINDTWIFGANANGIMLEISDNCDFWNIVVYNCQDGVEVEDGSDYNTFDNITIFNCSDNGFEFDEANHIEIWNCSVYNNSDSGIKFDSGHWHDYYNISGCYFINNTGYGINAPAIRYTTIYNNYFSNNGIQNANVASHSEVRFNITKTSGTNIIGGAYLCGNYWDDYGGSDIDSDGIGDTPYTNI